MNSVRGQGETLDKRAVWRKGGWVEWKVEWKVALMT